MRKSPMIVIALSLIAIVLYWTPLPSIGGFIIGGYPWIAPQDAKPIFFGIGIATTAILLLFSALTFYFSKRIEELDSIAGRVEEFSEFQEKAGLSSTGSSNASEEEKRENEEIDF